jgi:type I restriction enzyme S subunit
MRLYDGIDPYFVMYQFMHDARQGLLMQFFTGSTIKHFTGESLSRLRLRVAPSNEQSRIVAKIDELFSELDAGVASLKRAKALLKKYRQAVLKAAVSGELTRDWRERHKGEIRESGAELLQRVLKSRRQVWEAAELVKLRAKGKPPKDDRWKQKYKEPQPPDTTHLPDLPEGWVWASLPQLGEFGRGKSKHRPRNDPKLYGGDYPFIQTGVVREANGVIKDFDQTYNKTGLAQSKLWPKGAMCITIAANIAETGILGFDACFPDSVVGLVPHSDVRVQCVEYFMRTVREELNRYAPATAQKNINLEILFEVAVPLPPIAEQEAVVSETERLLSVVDALEAEIATGLRRDDVMRQSILSTAFSGKLVPQDLNDEPASVLLERIRAERAAKPRPTRGRRRSSETNRQLELLS